MNRNVAIGLGVAVIVVTVVLLLVQSNNLSQAETTVQAAQGTITAQAVAGTQVAAVATEVAATQSQALEDVQNFAQATQSALENSLDTANNLVTQQANDSGTAQAVSSATQSALEGSIFGLGVTATAGANLNMALQTQSAATSSAFSGQLSNIGGTATAAVENITLVLNNQAATQAILEIGLATEQGANAFLRGTAVAMASEATVAAWALGTAQAELSLITQQAPIETVATPVANVPVGDLIYEETFGTSSQWPVGDVRGAGNAALLDGQYVLTIDQTGGSIQVHNPPSLADAYAEVEVDLRDCESGGFVGMLARTQQVGQGAYFAAFACDFSFGGILLLSADQEPHALNTITLRPIDVSQIHVIGVKTQGDAITVYLDGEELVSATDSTYTEGSIGLYGGTTEDDLVVRFDNLRVWDVP